MPNVRMYNGNGPMVLHDFYSTKNLLKDATVSHGMVPEPTIACSGTTCSGFFKYKRTLKHGTEPPARTGTDDSSFVALSRKFGTRHMTSYSTRDYVRTFPLILCLKHLKKRLWDCLNYLELDMNKQSKLPANQVFKPVFSFYSFLLIIRGRVEDSKNLIESEFHIQTWKSTNYVSCNLHPWNKFCQSVYNSPEILHSILSIHCLPTEIGGRKP